MAALHGSPSEVIALFERAVEADPNHSGALFGLAMVNDRHGNDDTAMDLYERSVARFPAHLGSLLNLGILYEDRQQYERAQNCLPAHFGFVSQPSAGTAVFQRRGRPRGACSTTKTPSAAAIGSARC